MTSLWLKLLIILVVELPAKLRGFPLVEKVDVCTRNCIDFDVPR